MKSKKITLEEYQNLLTHTADRFVNFYIIFNHARLHRKSNIDNIFKLNNLFIQFWRKQGFESSEIDLFNLMPETWDILQSDFSYNRILNPDTLSKKQREKLKHAEQLLYDLKENEDVAVYDTEVTEKIENKLK